MNLEILKLQDQYKKDWKNISRSWDRMKQLNIASGSLEEHAKRYALKKEQLVPTRK